jgi:hypothetical protein
MRRTDLIEALRPGLFRPFRLYMSDGGTFEIRHPDMLMVTRHAALIGIIEKSENGDSGGGYPDIERTTKVDLMQVTRIEGLHVRPV